MVLKYEYLVILLSQLSFSFDLFKKNEKNIKKVLTIKKELVKLIGIQVFKKIAPPVSFTIK